MTEHQAKRIGLHKANRMTHIFDRRLHGQDDHSDAVVAAAIMAALNQPDTLENALMSFGRASRRK